MVPDLHRVPALDPFQPPAPGVTPQLPPSVVAQRPFWGARSEHTTFQETGGGLCVCQKPACCPGRADRARKGRGCVRSPCRVLLRGRGTATGRRGTAAGRSLAVTLAADASGAQRGAALGGLLSVYKDQEPECLVGSPASLRGWPGALRLQVAVPCRSLWQSAPCFPYLPGALPLPLPPQACLPSASYGFSWATRGPVSKACPGRGAAAGRWAR